MMVDGETIPLIPWATTLGYIFFKLLPKHFPHSHCTYRGNNLRCATHCALGFIVGC